MSKLPLGWVKKPLGDLADFVMGQAPPSSETNFSGHGVPFLQARNFGKRSPIVAEWTTKPLKFAEESDVLVCVVGATAGKVNLGANASITRSIAAIRPEKSKLNQLFLYFYMVGNVENLRARSSGSAQGVLGKQQLSELEIPLPPLDVQLSIVETLEDHLSRLDNAVELIRDNLSKNEVFRKSVLDRALFSKSTEIVPLGKLGKWHTGATPKTTNKLFEGDDVPFVTPGDVPNGGEIREVKRFVSQAGADSVRRVEAPSVQLVCIGATLGKVGISRQEVTTNQQINSLQPDESVADVDYVHWLLASQRVQELLWGASSSTTVPILNKGALSRIEVPIIEKVEQRSAVEEIQGNFEIANRLDSLLKESLEDIGKIRRSLLHAAFTGQLTNEDSND